MSTFWSLWIIVLTSFTIISMTWILFGNKKKNPKETTETTGHVYDGIEEFDNPLPYWWFLMFAITIFWGVALMGPR